MSPEPIAIVGSACRFPGSASSPSKLWDLLEEPRDLVKEFPPERLNFSNFFNGGGKRHGYTDVNKKSYLLDEDCRLFDAAFFRINPKEATGMDPQQRILLETVFEALEAAGQPLDTVEGSSTGVYVGVMTSDFNDIQMRDPETLPTYTATSLARSILSNRISYFFDLKGPSITLDTACSSSLVALHQAVECLRNGGASQAIVAGTTLLLDPGMYIAESKLHMLSPDSRSRMWDKGANGYARGEGCAAVLLKPLSKAIQDGDDIECIIRETGVNSDGRTNGITMPSSSAQAALIRKTYERAGLDPVVDRCQYFECHGTGTLAGDPIEARAIQEAFFPGSSRPQAGDPLYCGSIKTVIGHLEGCAGLAGVLKAALALKHKTIPPNMHFRELNPAIEPFYANLNVPTSKIPWPETNGQPLRASVNSFGFGGTNAHAILERYEPPEAKEGERAVLGPFVFSAKSRSALLGRLREASTYIKQNPSLDLDALSYTLRSKRSAFPVRIAFPSSSLERLLDGIGTQIVLAGDSLDSLGVQALTTNPDKPFTILGVFTGQGAQWATMGRELITHSQLFRQSLKRTEEALGTIPEAPEWSILEELMAEDDRSRISEAQFSQPLCTAIQIALVDLLHACNVRFDAVVGHSSGEIGAAYAVGLLNVRDAIAIAYYRGFVAHLAKGPTGQKGGMMAAGMSLEAATAFCSEPIFSDRIGVAASNSPSSVTLSGDLDAIHEAKEKLDGDKVFARLLKVDTAYHSHHMLHSADTYARYLDRLNIQIQTRQGDCSWHSSVLENGQDMLREPKLTSTLKGQYWIDNMVKPVLFSQAVELSVLGDRSPNLALEVGAHAALKGPANQTIKSSTGSVLPYIGCLARAENDVESMSRVIGFLWSRLGPSYVSFDGWRMAFGLPAQRKILKGLPTYSWDHHEVYWQESRLSHNYRLGTHSTHDLLGRLREDLPSEMTWRNVIDLEDLPWIRGHTFQGQVIFPGAGYVSLAAQAARHFVREDTISMIEIRDMNIARAVIVDEGSAGVEMVFTIRSKDNQSRHDHGSILEAEFVCHSCDDGRSLMKVCDGHLLLHLGLGQNMPLSPASHIELPYLDIDRFYQTMSRLDIVYDGVFRTLRSMNRALGHSKATATWEKRDLNEQYILHPAVLDVAFQAGCASFISVAEKALGSTYLPAGIKRILIDPSQGYQGEAGEISIEIESHLANSTNKLREVDINMCNRLTGVTGVQIDGLVLKAIAEPQPSDDRKLFAKTIWDIDAAYGVPSPPPRSITKEELEYIDAVERTALFFLQRIARDTKPEEIENFKWYHHQLLRAVPKFVEPIRQGRHAVLRKEWLNDDREIIDQFARRYPDSVDIALLTAVGEGLPSVLRGETGMLEHMLKDNLLGRLYMEGRGFSICNDYVADFVGKIVHKYPRSNLFEVGAGTGGTTRTVLDTIGEAYSTYTYTDISAGFFEKAAEKFADHAHKMNFKTFNAETRAAEQGFAEGSYDVVIAANVLHATRDLAQTMRHVRSLLRPGGYLVAVEVTGTMLREPGLMGGLEGWWLGTDDGRFPCPGVSAKEWHNVLQETGFSGVDSVMYDMPDTARHNCSVFVTQATDDDFKTLQDPLSSLDLVPEAPVIIVGGQTLAASKFAGRIERILRRWVSQVIRYTTLDDLNPSEVTPDTCVISLTDLDKAMFSEPIKSTNLENLQELLGNARNTLWITSGRLAEDPYSNMMIGIGRALSFELPHVHIQSLDFDVESSWDAEVVAQYLLRMALLSSDKYLDHNMLWAQEPEVAMQGDTTLIPRVVQDDAADEGLNAQRRQIIRPIDSSERVQALHSGSRLNLIKNDVQSTGKPDNYVELDVTYSVALHEGHRESACFLSVGAVANGELAYTLSEKDCSTVSRPRHEVLKLSLANFDVTTPVFLGSTLIAAHVLADSPTNGTLLVHEPTDGIAEAIENVAKATNRQVLFASSSRTEKEGRRWVHIHPHAQARTVRRLIPKDTTMVFTFTDVSIDNILPCLPKRCKIRKFNAGSLLSQHTALSAEFELKPRIHSEPLVINVSDITEASRELGPHRRLSVVLDWKRAGPVNAIIPPLESSGIFSPDKTYFMVGLAGELGQSLCRFMVSCGARHMVLSSRNPVVNADWLRDMALDGADVQIVKMDVSDREQVRETVSMLRRTMPEIGGVANGALVLEDTFFINATADNVRNQLKPKVDGTAYLDEEFASDDLEFFMAFSSLGSVYGNAGQSIYHAANMFMTSLVEKRRRRGQAASVINIGMIVDVGYVARSKRDGSNVEEHLRSQFYTPLAEAEFHHLFLQGVVSGRPGSTHADVTMGIQPFIDGPDVTTRPHWYTNPRFSHMIFSRVSSDGASQSTSSEQQLRQKLESVQTVAEAAEAYYELFCRKIESMMKIPWASINIKAPLSDLGLDSLLGVEIRTWLIQNMHTDVPLLKILGSDSIFSICAIAAQNLIQRKGLASEAEVIVGSRTAPKVELSVPEEESASFNSGSPVFVISDSQGSSTPNTQHSSKGTPSLSQSSQSSPEIQDTPLSSASSVSELPLASEPQDDKPQSIIDFKQTGRVSFAQASLHFLQNFLDDPTTFNVTAHYAINGLLNVTRFKRALEKTLNRHEAYRTCFFTEPGSLEFKQGVTLNSETKRYTHVNSKPTAEHIFQAYMRWNWALEAGHTFHATLITHSPESHSLVIGCHHIIMDGSSWHIFLRDLDRAYQMSPLRPVTTSYLDFARLQNESLADGQLDKHISYWSQQLDSIPGVLPLLPFAKTKSRKSRGTYGNHTVHTNLDAVTVQHIRTASQECRSTPMQFYLAVLQALLARFLELDDICIGLTDAGRGEDGSCAETVGHFTNLLPMRFQVNREHTFEELVRSTAKTVLNGFNHNQVPIEVILERLGVERSSVYPPLFQVTFNHRIGDLLHGSLGNCKLELVKYVDSKNPYDLSFNVTQAADGGNFIELSSNDDLYSREATQSILDAYVHLLESFSLDHSTKIQDCRPFTDIQVEKALDIGRGPRMMPRRWPETVTERFRDVCLTSPDSVAIKDDKESLAYIQLSHRVNGVVAALKNSGAGHGSRIAVLCEPSVDTYAAMLAILHLGAVYVPLDVSLPAARHHAMIDTCKPQLIICHPATSVAAADASSNYGLAMLNLSDVTPIASEVPSSANATIDSFLLFTSGSTGTPKGIRLSQAGILNYAASKSARLGLERTTVLQQSSTGFDMAIAQAFNAFANAGTLVVAPAKARGDPIMIAQLMLRESVELTICTPSEYAMLATYAAEILGQCKSWRYACSGGEAVTDRLLSELRRLELPELVLTDCYGPTEISCAATFQTIPLQPDSEDNSAPGTVGKAIPNVSIYIVGNGGEALPIGFPGEICVGGHGVAKGYLDEKLSSEKFVTDPFATPEDQARGWRVMYKTGDKGCLQEDGSVVFLGRMDGDTLVKLRGLRIELNEVANVILQTAQGSLADAVVTVRGEPGFLVAHVVFARREQPLEQAELEKICADLPLPRYMIPSMIIPLDRLSFTPNGKVDRKALCALPLPARNINSGSKTPLTVPEGELRLIWRDILGQAAGAADIGADTDFFTVGGSSLLLARLQNALKERMGVQMPLQDLYQASTLRRMAKLTSNQRSQLVEEAIDWDAETSIPDYVLEAAQTHISPRPRQNKRSVVLTGATGFIGSEVLRHLIKDDNVSEIHCIAVAPDAKHKVLLDDKVIIYEGSLLSPRLGLTRREQDELQAKTDQIIHAGAQGHCLNNYSSVRHANVISTQFLTALALPRRVPLHFISSARVILQSGQFAIPPVSVAQYPPPTDGSQGFTSSKWASERFLEAVARATGLPVAIHRPCSVIGDRAPHDDAMNSVVRFSLLSRKVPDVPHAEGFFDFKDAVALAGEIANGPIASAAPKDPAVSFRHHSSGVKVPFGQLARHMESLYGGTFETVSMDEWLQVAEGLGIEDLIVSYLKANVAGGSKLEFPYLGME
ncbi:lovastatin nonaketide synthase [Hypoxylon trugodes]|uniref:lovastatin nonaketide synthase n=1 Tax=Hypoxylon trugodes TaxID=326681 RepID=UPI002194326E|nr:lovastatin nonaketide synthase [Hypoxylon trugodes]KAI1387791.1 lovastatin nonaketide synthase [Hypoxylon trugodes]